MKKKIAFFIVLTISITTFSVVSFAQTLTAEQIKQEISENIYRCCGGYCPYDAPMGEDVSIKRLKSLDTKAPKGYKPFYISHLSRHGSRYHTRPGQDFGKVLPILEELKEGNMLTSEGEGLYKQLCTMAEVSSGKDGLLTQVGSMEHHGMGVRMARRYPAIFRRKNTSVYCSSTAVPRCIQSMANFGTGLQSIRAESRILYDVGLNSGFSHVSAGSSSSISDAQEYYQKTCLPQCKSLGALSARLFTDTSAVSRLTEGKTLQFLYDIYFASLEQGCIDVKTSPLDYFTLDELYELWTVYNIHHSAYGPLEEAMQYRIRSSANFARNFVLEADEAIQGNGHCADLRFAHDGNIGPFLTLLGVENWDKPLTDNAHLHWQGYRNLCMGSNVQFIFYRNGKDDVLVKILRNERETTIPALKSFSGPYYRWSELRRYILQRSGAIVEVPDYYIDYLAVKSQKIRELQKKEADGFYFITDMHFPADNGYSPSLIESLQQSCAPRKVIFGGDLMGTVHTIEEGKVPAEYAFQQMSSGQKFYMLRGNHDIKNRTTQGNWERQEESQWRVSVFNRFFCAPDAVFNSDDNDACYYYFDNKTARIRYVVYDSSDVGDRQQEWMNRVAISTVPKGWKLFILSHIVPASNPAPDSDVLMILGGHRHADMEDLIGGRFCVVTKADTFDSLYAARPYKETQIQQMVKGTPTGQVFDYVSISKDRKTVTMVRLGCGSDRIFHLEPLDSADDFVCEGARYVYDAGTVRKAKDSDGGNYVDASSTGKGDQVILVIREDGTRELSFVK